VKNQTIVMGVGLNGPIVQKRVVVVRVGDFIKWYHGLTRVVPGVDTFIFIMRKKIVTHNPA